MDLTHEDLADFAGATRETITRTLGRFQKDKLIQIRGVTVHILLPEKLADLAA
jgi:CRP/FNR family transcriptional regulator